MFPVFFIRKEFKKLVEDNAWEVTQSFENETVFTKGQIKIIIAAYDSNWEYIPIYDENMQNHKNMEIRYIEIKSITCLKEQPILFKKVIKDLSECADEFLFTIYINMNKSYKDEKDFNNDINQYNEMDFSLILKLGIPYCIRFHKNEKFTYMKMPEGTVEYVIQYAELLNPFCVNQSPLNYACKRAYEELIEMHTKGVHNIKNIKITEEYINTLLMYLNQDNEEFGTYYTEISNLQDVIKKIHNDVIYRICK